MTKLSRARTLFATVLAAVPLALSSAQADVAHLRNGRTLSVAGYRMEGERIVLLMEGGGEMALPNRQVLSIQRAPLGAAMPDTKSAPPPPAGPEGERLVAPQAAPQGPSGPAPAETPIVIQPGAVLDRLALQEVAARIARKHRVDERLVRAVIEVESRYDAFAVSPRGALGLMQLMPETAARFDVRNPYDPVENIEGGVRYLKELLDRYSGQRRLALAAYNAGQEAVEHFSGIPPYRETILYVDRVLRLLGR